MIVENFDVSVQCIEDIDRIEFRGDKGNTYHTPRISISMIIVRTQLTNEEGFGGLKLMVQDSRRDRPFFVVGLDLLQSMGVDRRCAIKPSLQFETGENRFEEEEGATLSFQSGGSTETDN